MAASKGSRKGPTGALWAARELLEEAEALVWKLAARAGVAHA